MGHRIMRHEAGRLGQPARSASTIFAWLEARAPLTVQTGREAGVESLQKDAWSGEATRYPTLPYDDSPPLSGPYNIEITVVFGYPPEPQASSRPQLIY
jgi:hypothetical protein